VKILAALGRVAGPRETPTQRAEPFDDGLVELARLIAREDPAGDAEAAPEDPSDVASSDKTSTDGVGHVSGLDTRSLVPQEGFEPPTPSLRMTCSTS
jgi:hypothetical protein